MIGTLLFAAFAVFLGWLGFTVSDPNLGGLFLVGAIISAGCAVVWYLDARRLRRSTRC